MKQFLVITGAVVLLASPVLGRSIPGAPNEVADPWFIDYVEAGPDRWYVSGGNGFFLDYPVAPVSGGYHFDPGMEGGDQGFLRTIVDNYDGLWNDEYSDMRIDLFFYAHVEGNGYIKVRFDWWDDPEIPMPPDDPNDPPPPDGTSVWYTLTGTNLGPFRTAWDLVADDEDPIPGAWIPYSFAKFWDHQPRWVSIEFDLGVTPGGLGEAYLTGIDFESECRPSIPAVSEWGLVVMALIGLAVGTIMFRRLKRHPATA